MCACGTICYLVVVVCFVSAKRTDLSATVSKQIALGKVGTRKGMDHSPLADFFPIRSVISFDRFLLQNAISYAVMIFSQIK